MEQDLINHVRKLSQHYAYSSLQMHESIARKVGISGTDHKYLGFLIQNGQMTAGEFASLTGLTTGAITGLIDRFEKRKLVKRQYAEDDRRKVFIEPNIKNIMTLLEPLYKEFRSESQKLFASFSNRELKILEAYFQQAIDIMDRTTSRLQK